MQEPAGDDDLIARVRAGSPVAFSELVRRHQGAVRGLLARYLRARDAVDDLAQEVFLAALRGIDGYRGDATFRLWLLAIARRHAAGHLRDQIRRRARGANVLELAIMGWHADALERGVVAARDDELWLAALQDCLGRLPAESAALVSAHYFRAESLADIARRHGKREGALRMTLLRIRQALRECVQRRLMVESEP